jgi:hypothetical protein
VIDYFSKSVILKWGFHFSCYKIVTVLREIMSVIAMVAESSNTGYRRISLSSTVAINIKSINLEYS